MKTLVDPSLSHSDMGRPAARAALLKAVRPRNPKRTPKHGDRLVKILTNRAGMEGVYSRIVLWVEPPPCCHGTGKTLVIPVTAGRMNYHTRCFNRCTKKTLPDRTTVCWTRKLPKAPRQPKPCRCTLREWWTWAKDAHVAESSSKK